MADQHKDAIKRKGSGQWQLASVDVQQPELTRQTAAVQQTQRGFPVVLGGPGGQMRAVRRAAGGIQVEMAVSARGLRHPNFQSPNASCIVYLKSRGSREWKRIGRTEMVQRSENPEFAKTFQIDFYFEEKQQLRFELYDWQNERSDDPYGLTPLGTMECSLAEILRHGNNKYERGLSPYKQQPGDCGVIVVYFEEKAGLKDLVTFEITGSNLDKKDVFSESDPFFTISRVNSDGSDTLVYRSEWIKDNPDPEWGPVKISSGKLCNGDWNRAIKFEVFDHDMNGGHDYIGEYNTTLDEMSAGEGFQILQWDVINVEKREKKLHKKDYINSGTVILKSISIQEDTTFLDYIRGGLKLHLVVAIDFTLSNGDPRRPDSLHHVDRQSPENPYTMAIRSVGDIFQEYDYDRQFTALGFGGLFNGRLSHCFPLNGNTRHPQCRGIDGVLGAYYHSLDKVRLSDPTCFSHVIEYVKRMAEDMRGGGGYAVLLIVTDGGVEDLEEVKRLLVENSHLPMSIILVGVGKGDMTLMNILDDDQRTMSYRGLRAERDIVQFVQMNQYLGGCFDPATFNTHLDAADAKFNLAKDVLAEIPSQVVQYMQRNGIKPGIPSIQDTVNRMQRFHI